MTRLIVCAIVSLVLGTGVGWLIARQPQLTYRTTTGLALTLPDGRPTGSLPAGTPVLSAFAPESHPDIGWPACVPIYFGTTNEASALVERADPKIAEMVELRLSAGPPEGVSRRN